MAKAKTHDGSGEARAYEVLTPVVYDEVRYEKGETITLTDAHAKQLLEVKAIADPSASSEK